MKRLHLLGALDLVDETGTSLVPVLAQPKRMALLVHLALAEPPGFQRRDVLLALFWPESDTEAARRALRQALYFLRRHLGADTLPSRGDEEVALRRDALWCDVLAIREALAAGRLEEALAAYAGGLLPGFHVRDAAPEFDSWLEAERSRLHRRMQEAARTLRRAAEAAGDLAGALRWARRALALSPDDPVAVRAVMRLEHGTGDLQAAVATFEAFARRREADGLGAPDDETTALIGQLRHAPVPDAGPPLLAASTVPAVVAPPTATPAAPAAPPATPAPPHRLPRPPRALAVLALSALSTTPALLLLATRRPPSGGTAATASVRPVARIPRDSAAERLFQVGIRQLQHGTRPEVARARASFTQALERDPEHQPALFALATAYIMASAGFGDVPPDDAYPRARALGERLLALSPTSPDGLWIRATVRAWYDWEWAAAERIYRQGLSQAPSHVELHVGLAILLQSTGRFEEALQENARAAALDPLQVRLRTNRLTHLLAADQLDECLRAATDVYSLDPNFAQALALEGTCLALLGRRSDAVARAEQALRVARGTPRIVGEAAAVFALAGQRAAARRLADQLERRARLEWVDPGTLALVRAVLGERDAAMRHLEAAVARRSRWIIQLGTDPRFDPLRGDSRFEALLARVGLSGLRAPRSLARADGSS